MLEFSSTVLPAPYHQYSTNQQFLHKSTVSYESTKYVANKKRCTFAFTSQFLWTKIKWEVR